MTTFIFTFLMGIGVQEIIALFLSGGILALIFWGLRPLILWYLKIDQIILNQQKQIHLLMQQNQDRSNVSKNESGEKNADQK